MKKQILVFIVMISITITKAQTGMVTNNPNPNAVLDLNPGTGVNTKGLVLPKVNLSSTLLAAPLSDHVEGMMLYNTATAGSGIEKVTEGIYYNDGSKWIRLMDTLNWETTGNSSTTATANFIGTTDATDLVTRTNNIERTRVTTTGKTLINTDTTPAGSNAKLIINNGTAKGALQIRDGTQAKGKGLITDANGVGTWKNLGDEAVYQTASVVSNGINIPTTNATSNFTYVGYSITLKPGKWMINMHLRLVGDGGSTTNGTYWFRATLSDSMTTMGVSSDIGVPGANAKYITKTVHTTVGHENVSGNIIVNNTSSSDKTYYLVAPPVITYNNSSSTGFYRLGATWGDLNNVWIYAQRIK